MAHSLPITFTDDEAAALDELARAVFGEDISQAERERAVADAAKEQLRSWLVSRKIDLDQMMLASQWEPQTHDGTIVRRTEDWRDAVVEHHTDERNRRIREWHEAQSELADELQEAGKRDEADEVRRRQHAGEYPDDLFDGLD